MINAEFLRLNAYLIYGGIALLSLLIGSLLNVIIYRLPLMLKAELLAECQCLLNLPSTTKTINLFFPRSFCPKCNKTVNAIHNIPLISYLFLRGRCAYCKDKISLRYPFIEALSCLLAVYASWHFGLSITLVFALLFIWSIIALLFIDLDHHYLPDSLTLSLLWLGLIANIQSTFTSLPNAVLSAVGAYLALWLFIQLFYLFTGKIGMGHGDFKLFAAFGAWFGWTKLPLILLIASMTGAIIGSIYLKSQKQSTDTPIAFGPFLCLGGFIVLFWGGPLITWYLTRYT